MKPGRNICKLHLKAQLKDEEETQEVSVSLAAAEEIDMDAAVAGPYFHIKRGRKNGTERFPQ